MILAIQITLWINIIALAIYILAEVWGVVDEDRSLGRHLFSIAGNVWLIFVFLKIMNIV